MRVTAASAPPVPVAKTTAAGLFDACATVSHVDRSTDTCHEKAIVSDADSASTVTSAASDPRCTMFMSTVPIVSVVPAASPEDDAALGAKLNAYIECSNRHSNMALKSRNRYLSWLRSSEQGPTGRESIVYGLYSLYDPADCYTAIATASYAIKLRAQAQAAQAADARQVLGGVALGPRPRFCETLRSFPFALCPLPPAARKNRTPAFHLGARATTMMTHSSSLPAADDHATAFSTRNPAAAHCKMAGKPHRRHLRS